MMIRMTIMGCRERAGRRLVMGVMIGVVTLFAGGCAMLPNSSSANKNRSKEDPSSVHTQLGWNYLQRGQLNVAKTELERALELNPRSAKALHVMGLLRSKIGEPKLADKSLARAVHYAPNNLDIRQDYATFLCQQRRVKEGLHQYQVVLDSALNRSRESTLTLAGLCLLRKPDAEAAEQYLRQALEGDPQIPEALSAMSALLYNGGEFLKARAYLERYHSVGPESAASLSRGLLIESRLGDADAAQQYAMRLKTQFPDSRQAKRLARTGQLGAVGSDNEIITPD